MDHTLLLNKLARVARTQCDSDLEQLRSSWVAFELVCALEKSEELQRQVYLWPDVDSDIKDKLGLPQEDIGIDYMDKECSFAGQAKCYISTTRVPTTDIDRTRFCMYRGSRYAKEDILPRCEIATPEGVALGRCRASMGDVDHKIITNEVIEKWYERCMETALVEEDNLQIQEEGYLRECQVKALENILPGRVNKIKLACGSGKTKIAVEVIARKPGAYLVLVPYITLLEQWGAYLKQFDFKVYMVGTGYELPEKVTRKLSETVVIVSVYDSYEKAIYLEREGRVMYRTFECVFVDEAHHIDEREDNRSGEIWKFINRKGKMAVMLSASLGEDADYNYTLRNAIDDKICCDYDVRVAYFDVLPTMESIAKYISENTEYLSILAYCNSIKSARLLAEECKKRGVTAESLSCNESRVKRKRIISEFENGKFRVLVSVNTLGEGINLRCADTCLFAEARSSAVSIVQCIGRVVRQYKGKEMAHVVVCTNVDKEENISGHPVVKILRALAREDPVFIRKVTSKQSESSRIRNECVREEDDKKYEKRATWLKDELFDSIMDFARKGDWYLWFEELKKYKEEKGKFPTIGENKELYYWYTNQKLFARNGKLGPERKKNLDEAFGESWLPQVRIKKIRSWEESFEELKKYKEEEKGKFPSKLYYWYNKQKKDARNGKLDPERKKNLDEAFGERWLPQVRIKGDRTWEESFEELKKYKEEKGKFPLERENKRLYSWYEAQKQVARKDKLDPERKMNLDEEFGENWWLPLEKKIRSWEESFEELKKYKEKCNLPLRKNKELSRWYDLQKHYARNGKLDPERKMNLDEAFGERWLLQKNKTRTWGESFEELRNGKLDPERKMNLDEAFGERWLLQKNKTRTRSSTWGESFEELKKYKEEKGKFPTIKENKDLYQWYARQKYFARNGKLDPERKRKMDEEFGENWLSKVNKIQTWEESFEELKKYKEEKGNFPLERENKELYSWYIGQKHFAKKGKLDPKRKRNLDEAFGESWLSRRGVKKSPQ